MLISTAYAQAPAPSAAAEGGLFGSLSGMLPIIFIFVVLYFVMIRPQMKRQKETKAMLAALQKGDEIATIGGVVGTITRMGDNMLTVEVASGVEVQIQRYAVSQVLPKGTRG